MSAYCSRAISTALKGVISDSQGIRFKRIGAPSPQEIIKAVAEDAIR